MRFLFGHRGSPRSAGLSPSSHCFGPFVHRTACCGIWREPQQEAKPFSVFFPRSQLQRESSNKTRHGSGRRPAGKRAGIAKCVGWHMFRHGYATLLKHHGADVKVVRELLRHSTSRVSMDVYTQAMTPAKRDAQTNITRLLDAGTQKLAPYGPMSLPDTSVSD